VAEMPSDGEASDFEPRQQETLLVVAPMAFQELDAFSFVLF